MSQNHPGARAAVSYVCAGLCALAAFSAARLAYAEALFRRDSPSAIRQALWLDRGAPPTHYFERLAELEPERPAGPLHEALLHDPRRSSAWIALGLDAERRGSREEAEFDLLEAARVDRRYLPAWTLANYYFRQGDPAGFWPQARRAAELAYDDLGPLLQLAHTLEPDALTVLDKLGGGDRLVRADLDYLTGAGQFDEAQRVARLLLARRSPADQPRLIEMTERQIHAGNAGYARELWNGLFPPADSRQALTNGDLQQRPRGIGFDWRVPVVDGVTAEWSPSQLTFTFSGDQAESCSILEQIAALAPHGRYRLSFEYVTANLPVPSGMRWDLDGEERPSLEPSSAWREASVVFARPHASLSRLRLLYRREPGTTRARGGLELRYLRMQPIP